MRKSCNYTRCPTNNLSIRVIAILVDVTGSNNNSLNSDVCEQKMSVQAAKLELNSLTPFQQEIHTTSNMSEEIISSFYQPFMKCTWYTSLPMRLKCTSDGDETIYAVNDSFHFLNYTYMRFVLPHVRVKPELKGRVRIAWCHNVGSNITLQACFKEDDETYHTWDHVWADIYSQFYQYHGAGKRENHNVGVGNVSCLEEWSEALPAYPINIDQPWFYSTSPTMAFPIFFKNSLTRAEHRYTFRRKITDLLRVQIMGKDRKWKDVANSKIASRYIEGDYKSDTIKTPELWGRYSYITENEVSWHKCRTERVFYTHDVEVCDTANPSVFGANAEIDLHTTNPCLAFFWVAENVNATAIRNFSNYTTDDNDIYSGWDPVRNTTLLYGTAKRLDNMPSDHFSIAEPRKHFPSAPNERGYHGYSFAGDSTNIHADIGVVLSNVGAKLRCFIADNNIFNTTVDSNIDDQYDDDIADLEVDGDASEDAKVSKPIVDSTEVSQAEFRLRTRLLVMRKFTIAADKDGKYTYNIK